MYGHRTLLAKLAKLPLAPRVGPWSRLVALEYLQGPPPGAATDSGPDPLWPGGSKLHGQRFTPRGSFDTLYVCADQVTALLEVRSAFRGPHGMLRPTGVNPQVLVTIEGAVTRVLDLTKPSTMKALGTSTAELTGAWAYVPEGGEAPTQRLGRAAYASQRIRGLLYTSAVRPSTTCLCVFPDRLDPAEDRLTVIDSSGTIVSQLPR